MRRILLGMIPLLVGIAIGCDNKSATQSTDDVPPPPPVHVAPTTQELLDGPRKLLPLPTMRLAISVPQSWSLDASDAKLVMLQGPAPGGDVQIKLTPHSSIPTDQVEMTHTGLKNQAATDPEHWQVPDIRVINGMKVVEQVEIPGPSTRPSVHRLMTWEVTVYIPDGDAVLPRAFNFIDLTPEQYASDGKFLRSILDSITKDKSAEIP